MADPVTSALLLVVAIAYLAGAFLVVAALQDQAAGAMAAVPPLVDLTPPATDVVAYLGAPTGDDVRPVGDGGLAVTRFRAGRPTVVFAQAALTNLSPAAVQSLAAHDLLTAPTGVC